MPPYAVRGPRARNVLKSNILYGPEIKGVFVLQSVDKQRQTIWRPKKELERIISGTETSWGPISESVAGHNVLLEDTLRIGFGCVVHETVSETQEYPK